MNYKLISVAKAAEVLNVSTAAIYYLIKNDDEFPAFRLGHKIYKIDVAALDAYIAKKGRYPRVSQF